jgi:tetratricopeptide (TPR) repeat protein
LFQILLNTPTKIYIPAEGKELPEGLPEPIVSLPPNQSVGQLQTALKTLKPTCAGIVSEYSCGNHDTAPAYGGEIISVNAGDEVAMNTMIISIVDIDGSGNGSGLIKVPMMNNIKIGVALSGIKVAKGGCIVAGKAETSGIDVAILNEKQRQNLAKAYEIYKKTLDIAEELAPEIAKGINDVKDYFEALKAKKEATRKLLAQSNLEDLSEVLNNCAEIVSQSRVAQDSLEKTICLIKTGKAKGNIAKLEKASKANIDFINKLGPALAQCQNTTFTPWAEQPCKGPCGESFVVDYSDFNCQKEMSGVFGVKDPINYKVTINIESELWLDNEGRSFYKVYIQCDKQITETPSRFFVSYNGNNEIFPFSYEGGIIAAHQNSFVAYNHEYPMAGKVGDNLFSIASGKTDDYLFFGRVLEFCPNLVDDAQIPWKKYFMGAKGMTKTTAFAETVKTISDVSFAVVDGWYICKDITKAIRLGWRGFGRGAAKEIVGKLEYIHIQKPNKITNTIELERQLIEQIDAMNAILKNEGMIGLKNRIKNYSNVVEDGRKYVKTLGSAGKDKVWAHIPDMRVGGGPKDISKIPAGLRENSILGGQADKIANDILKMSDDITKIEYKLLIK